ncbi:MAG: AAA family ATPase, partial [Myxococcales bacterium]|nr:AAA family ATPase [Myxococcales bacterium]
MFRLPGHEFDELLRRDSHATIHRGRRQADGLGVVAKVLADTYPRAIDLAALRHEYALARELAGEGVAAALSLIEHGHGLALIWADPGGVPLRRLLEQGPPAPTLALAIAASLARTLDRLHGQGVVYKNLCPDEVLVDPQSGSTWILGFAAASKLAREQARGTDPVAACSLAYRAPEQTGRMNRIVDRRSDLYALGVVLYELLTGSRPFVGDDMALIHAHLALRPQPPHERVPALSRVLSAVVMKLLEKSAEDRYQYAATAAADLQACRQQLERGESPDDLDALALLRGDIDRGAALDIPQRLYGREAELETMLQAWQRVEAGAGELLLVRCYSGIGKSALVHEIHRELVTAGGHFIAGKFDQLGRALPHLALITAFGERVKQLLAAPEGELDRFRAALAAELGLAVPAAVLTGMIPELARVIGEQEPAPELTGAAAQRRLTLAVRALLRASTAGDRPLVLFLDDLQWADLASLELLEALLQEQLPRLLLIGAYRSNEVDPGHPLTAMLQAVAATCTTHAVELGPLARGDVLRLIADALHMERELVAPLARQIYDKAEGNPFFTIRLLLALHEDGLLAWDQEARRYHWDEGAVGAVAAADNVVAFMGERLGRLPAVSRRVLELAACIGHRFELGTLAQIGEQAIAAVVAALWPALEQGVIVALDEGYRYLLRTWPEGEGDATEIAASVATVGFRFLHDRVQQAAYDGIAEDQRPRLHLQIGRLLRAGP